MIKQAMIGGAAGLLLATNTWAATAEQASTQERVGLTSGAVIGGLAGGPLGLVFGAAFGAWLGDQFHDERSERIASEESWRQASAQVTELNAQLLGNLCTGDCARGE
jgi:MFS family permease